MWILIIIAAVLVAFFPWLLIPIVIIVGILVVKLIRVTKNEDKVAASKPVTTMTGIEYESYVAKRLRAEGYTNVRITPPTGDYGADVLATNKKGVRFAVQCKKYSGSVGVDAVQEAIAGQQYYGCDRAMVVTTSTFTQAAKTLANRANVILCENFNDLGWIDRIEEYDAGMN